MADRVRVLVVDDSPTTRTMLREALALDGGIEVVGEANGGREAITTADELHPDVVLLDVRMSEGDGVQAAQQITTRHPRTRIVALTWSDDPRTVRDMLAAGAIGYVVKGGTIDELVGAIRRARAGEPELDQRVLPAAMDDLRHLLEQEKGRRQEVERLAKAKAEFVQVLSHELRTPLTVILGTLRMLHAAGVRAQEAPLLESALRRADELEFLVEGLELVGAGPDAGGLAYPLEAIRVATERLGTGPDAVHVADEPWEGVPQRFVERVAFDLLSNAIRHGERPIEVSGARDENVAVLTVGDAGGWGASEDDFAAFTQQDMSDTRSRGGFGLGLFLAQRLCQATGGGLRVEAVAGRTLAEARFGLRKV
ncbi:MAG TPA: response regulator [Actinomycetota bacterium]|jgi:DNA-binding NarL/FixJ family response regulator